MSFGGMRIRPWTTGSPVRRDSGEAAPPRSTHGFGDYGAAFAPPLGLTRRPLGRGEGGPSPRPGFFPLATVRVIR
jgi:hypothetical protein